MMATAKSCSCPCHRMTGILTALFGLNFLLKHFGIYSDSISNIVWPSIIILVGLKHASKGMCNCCSDG